MSESDTISFEGDEQPDGAASSEPLAQPEGSSIVFLATPESFTYIIPRTGFRGAALFFLIFSLIWSGITGIVALVFLFSFIKEPDVESLLVLAFLSIFVAIGALMFLAGIQFAFRKAVFVATPDSLVCNQIGPLRKGEFQWPAADLIDIRADYSGTTINDRRFRELRIETVVGHKGFFDGRDDAELFWFADSLRRYYALPPKSVE